MASEVPFPPPGFDELSIDEQIEYVGKLGERIPQPPDEITDPNIAFVEERLAYYEENGMEEIPWEQFRQELLEQLAKG
jgi:putative addiction module component (TIGR02574 family)